MELADSSCNGGNMYISGWSGTTASLCAGYRGNYFRLNIGNPFSEQTYLKCENDRSIFAIVGEQDR